MAHEQDSTISIEAEQQDFSLDEINLLLRPLTILEVIYLDQEREEAGNA